MKYSYIEVRTNSTKKPNVFVGTALRGTFGHVLKEYVCIEPSYECDGCTHQSTCLSYDFYPLKDDKYRFYRTDARIDAQNYDFGFYLFGDFSLHIRTIAQALNRMLLSGRITPAKLSFPKSQILYNGKELQFDRFGTLLPFESKSWTIIPSKKFSHDIKITLLTPVFIKEKNSYKKNITLEDILNSIYKRKYFFEHQKMIYKVPHQPTYVSVSPMRRKRESALGNRYSTKQNQSIPIEGILGEITVKGLDTESYELLKWGEVLGVGKGTALGNGVIKVE